MQRESVLVFLFLTTAHGNWYFAHIWLTRVAWFCRCEFHCGSTSPLFSLLLKLLLQKTRHVSAYKYTRQEKPKSTLNPVFTNWNESKCFISVLLVHLPFSYTATENHIYILIRIRILCKSFQGQTRFASILLCEGRAWCSTNYRHLSNPTKCKSTENHFF